MFQINAIREKDKNFSKVLKMRTIKVFVLVVFCVSCVSAYGRPKKGKFSVHKSKFKNMIIINMSNLQIFVIESLYSVVSFFLAYVSTTVPTTTTTRIIADEYEDLYGRRRQQPEDDEDQFENAKTILKSLDITSNIQFRFDQLLLQLSRVQIQ